MIRGDSRRRISRWGAGFFVFESGCHNAGVDRGACS
jgi:hypothetical protein